MRVLVACEFSGIMRDAFISRGHEAVSCDLLPTERPGPHIRGDVRLFLDGLRIYRDEYSGNVLGYGSGHDGYLETYPWDLLIAHPPCTHLAVSGARWFKYKQAAQAEALEFVRTLLDAPIPRIALENPISIISSRIRKPDQIVQPWQFGHPETKATCLWLKNLPLLEPTRIVEGREARVHRMPPSADRWKLRSLTYQGIAEAMADQWAEATP